MDARPTPNIGHSADVRIALAVNGHIFSVAQLGAEAVVLRRPMDHPPAGAEIAMTIDSVRTQWRVELTEGIVAARPETPIRRCPPPFDG